MGCQNLHSGRRAEDYVLRRNLSGLALALVAFATLVSPAVLAQATATPPSARDPLAIYREAGISQDQENQIRDIVKDFESANSVRIEKMRNLLQEMRALSLQPAPEDALVLGKQEEINKLQAEVSNERIKLLLKIRSLMSADQKKKLVDLMQRTATTTPQ